MHLHLMLFVERWELGKGIWHGCDHAMCCDGLHLLSVLVSSIVAGCQGQLTHPLNISLSEFFMVLF